MSDEDESDVDDDAMDDMEEKEWADEFDVERDEFVDGVVDVEGNDTMEEDEP